MLISRLGGRIVTESDTTLGSAEKVQVLFEADDTINVGYAVGIDLTSSTTGKLVVAAPVDEHVTRVGIYEGDGGSGAETTTSGLSGRTAKDGDIIYVTAYGVAKGYMTGNVTGIVKGTALGVFNTAGLLEEADYAAASGSAFGGEFVNLDTAVTNNTGYGNIFVKCL